MRYTPKFFKAYELVPMNLYMEHGDNSFLYIDDRILWTVDKIRETLKKKITVNNWKTGGQFSQRGYRTDSVGATYSAHRFGRAIDFDIDGMTANHFRMLLKEGSFADEVKYVTRVEDAVNWVHIDCVGLPRTAGQAIEFFQP